MKNVKIFEQLRLRAHLDDEHYRKQKEISEEYETTAYKRWRADLSDKTLKAEFHRACDETRKYERLIEKNEPYLGEKWYMTEYLYTDCHAYEVIEVYSIDKMDVRQLKATLTEKSKKELHDSFIPGGFCGHFDNELQEYTYESDEKQPIITVRRHKDGMFYRPNTRTCPFIVESEPNEYRDFNF